MIPVAAAAAVDGRTACCCGNCSRSAALRTRPFPSRSCSACYATDIAWKDRLIVHLNCKFNTHSLRRSVVAEIVVITNQRRNFSVTAVAASLSLVSSGAATDGVTLFFLKILTTFLVVPWKVMTCFRYRLVTTPILSPSPTAFVQCKKMSFHSLGSCHTGQPSAPWRRYWVTALLFDFPLLTDVSHTYVQTTIDALLISIRPS